jgi:hypothetical protein
MERCQGRRSAPGAKPLILADFDTPPDLMVMQALQYLHGFDMTYRSSDHRLISHGLPGPYVRTLEQVAAEFDAWRARCASYEPDAAGWAGGPTP